jgi:Ni,Fe-hydrogenase I cytochrome b subunit
VTFYALFALEAHVTLVTLFALVGSGTYLATPVVTKGAVTVCLPHEDSIFREVVQVVHLAYPFLVSYSLLYIRYRLMSSQNDQKKNLFYVMCAT